VREAVKKGKVKEVAKTVRKERAAAKRNILGTFFYLYLVTDISSRRIVAARVYGAENDEHAAELFTEVTERVARISARVAALGPAGTPG